MAGIDGPAGEQELREIEQTAVELARLAGTEIVSALGRMLAVAYKNLSGDDASLRDPVSEVDRHAEELIRSRLGKRFPDHAILGEEFEAHKGTGGEFVWVVDPVDGTANFVNGFPLFAASVGVLRRGVPVAGAVWCSTTHALRSGVYHAHLGGPLCFEEEPLARQPNPAVRRRLVGLPETGVGLDPSYDARKSGSAAVECAFVAAGLLAAARFERPNVWDVGAGLALVRAAGLEAWGRNRNDWMPLDRLGDPVAEGGIPSLEGWRPTIVIGGAEAARALRAVGA
ncbi:inositol monophosphatase family protein [Arenibaculum pallidiluteum]|uniref:inositol monophosphatase family protein n=1 Tax=Arenibaculum pallidiluteum TaxID=2812559 RepID=UPI001A966285|nr:inositol monophosphatase [Arenibaculum pallidiluteum]